MADQGRWFKLWCGFDGDEKLGNLALDDLARWTILGAYVKQYGLNGHVRIYPPCYPLQARFRVRSFGEVLSVLHRLPSCTVTRGHNSGVTSNHHRVDVHKKSTVTPTVTGDGGAPMWIDITWRNWMKYQGDMSRERTRRWRKKQPSPNVSDVTILEERRGEEKRREYSIPPPPPPAGGGVHRKKTASADYDLAFLEFWGAYPRRVGKGAAAKAWCKGKCNVILKDILAATKAQSKSEQWQKAGGQFIPHPATWLNQRRWEDDPDTATATPDIQHGRVEPTDHSQFAGGEVTI